MLTGDLGDESHGVAGCVCSLVRCLFVKEAARRVRERSWREPQRQSQLHRKLLR